MADDTTLKKVSTYLKAAASAATLEEAQQEARLALELIKKATPLPQKKRAKR